MIAPQHNDELTDSATRPSMAPLTILKRISLTDEGGRSAIKRGSAMEPQRTGDLEGQVNELRVALVFLENWAEEICEALEITPADIDEIRNANAVLGKFVQESQA